MPKQHVISGLLVLLLGLAASLAVAGQRRSEYESVIPPEILNRYDLSVIDDKRPKLIRITQDMIWGLRDKPNQGGDVYSFDLDPGKLSSVQRRIIREWVRSGASVLFFSAGDASKYATLFDDAISVGRSDNPLELCDHPVNTDVRNVDFQDYRDEYRGDDKALTVLTKFPGNTEIIARDEKTGNPCAARVPYGAGTINVALLGKYWGTGVDRLRWELNFKQWVVGLKVPGAAAVRVTGRPASQTLPDEIGLHDRVQLKNGDTISGILTTTSITIETSYAKLAFKPAEIDNVILEGAGQNIETLILRNGDEISGKLGPAIFRVRLQNGQETEIEKDKIKEIVIQAPRPEESEQEN